jgi:hypothetical protein
VGIKVSISKLHYQGYFLIGMKLCGLRSILDTRETIGLVPVSTFLVLYGPLRANACFIFREWHLLSALSVVRA